MTEYCTVIGPALYKAAEQPAVKKLWALAKQGAATRDYCLTMQSEVKFPTTCIGTLSSVKSQYNPRQIA